MKKVFTLIALAGIFTFVACGPSKEEIEAKAKTTADSIALVEAAKIEEMKAKMIEDSTAAYNAALEAKTKATADSIAAAAELAKAKTSKATKPKATKPATAPVEKPVEQPKRTRSGKIN